MANNWQQTKVKIINRARRLAGVLSTGEDPSSAFFKNKFTEASDALHAFLLSEQNEIISPFKITRSQSTFTESSLVTNNSSNYRCILGHTASSLTEPGVGAEWTTYWTEDGDGGDGAWVTGTAYTSKHEITLSADTISIQNVSIRDLDNDYPVTVVPREHYYGTYDKTSEGVPSEAFFDAQLTPKIYLWPQPEIEDDGDDYVLHYDEVKIFNDFDGSSDTGVSTSNFPQRWIDFVTFGLAHRLAIEEQIPIDRIRLLKGMMKDLKKAVKLRDSQDLVNDSTSPCP